jgi:hypothetical protein
MRIKRTFFGPLFVIGASLALAMAWGTCRAGEAVTKFTFSVLSDLQSDDDSWENALAEVRDGKTNPEPAFTRTELVLIAGDMLPLAKHHEDYRRAFANPGTRPLLLPVIGNHDFEDGNTHFRYARDVLIPAIPGVVRRHAESCDYYVDYKNVRIIAVDGYTDLGERGVIGEEGRLWVEQVIKSAPSAIDHIFVSFHEPAFPRIKHIGSSFDKKPKLRNAFWRMLLANKDRVRAVFVGHTHFYSRMRVLDPAGAGANDPNAFPDEEGGIYQINAATAGVVGDVNTIVQVQVDGGTLRFRALRAKNGANEPFEEIDKWSIVGRP